MNKKEFVDKWVGKHGFAGIFHNYRKDCIQDLKSLVNSAIEEECIKPLEKFYDTHAECKESKATEKHQSAGEGTS